VAVRRLNKLEKKGELFRASRYFCCECGKEIKEGYSCVVFTVLSKRHRVVKFNGRLSLSQTSNFSEVQFLLCKFCEAKNDCG